MTDEKDCGVMYQARVENNEGVNARCPIVCKAVCEMGQMNVRQWLFYCPGAPRLSSSRMRGKMMSRDIDELTWQHLEYPVQEKTRTTCRQSSPHLRHSQTALGRPRSFSSRRSPSSALGSCSEKEESYGRP